MDVRLQQLKFHLSYNQPPVCLLSEAKLAIVPFYVFGAPKTSPWYRLSVGTCKKDEIDEMITHLKTALSNLK